MHDRPARKPKRQTPAARIAEELANLPPSPIPSHHSLEDQEWDGHDYESAYEHKKKLTEHYMWKTFQARTSAVKYYGLLHDLPVTGAMQTEFPRHPTLPAPIFRPKELVSRRKSNASERPHREQGDVSCAPSDRPVLSAPSLPNCPSGRHPREEVSSSHSRPASSRAGPSREHLHQGHPQQRQGYHPYEHPTRQRQQPPRIDEEEGNWLVQHDAHYGPPRPRGDSHQAHRPSLPSAGQLGVMAPTPIVRHDNESVSRVHHPPLSHPQTSAPQQRQISAVDDQPPVSRAQSPVRHAFGPDPRPISPDPALRPSGNMVRKRRAESDDEIELIEQGQYSKRARVQSPRAGIGRGGGRDSRQPGSGSATPNGQYAYSNDIQRQPTSGVPRIHSSSQAMHEGGVNPAAANGLGLYQSDGSVRQGQHTVVNNGGQYYHPPTQGPAHNGHANGHANGQAHNGFARHVQVQYFDQYGQPMGPPQQVAHGHQPNGLLPQHVQYARQPQYAQSQHAPQPQYGAQPQYASQESRSHAPSPAPQQINNGRGEYAPSPHRGRHPAAQQQQAPSARQAASTPVGQGYDGRWEHPVPSPAPRAVPSPARRLPPTGQAPIPSPPQVEHSQQYAERPAPAHNAGTYRRSPYQDQVYGQATGHGQANGHAQVNSHEQVNGGHGQVNGHAHVNGQGYVNSQAHVNGGVQVNGYDGHSQVNDHAQVQGHSHANGQPNGHVNGHVNGYVNGQSNGQSNGHPRGFADDRKSAETEQRRSAPAVAPAATTLDGPYGSPVESRSRSRASPAPADGNAAAAPAEHSPFGFDDDFDYTQIDLEALSGLGDLHFDFSTDETAAEPGVTDPVDRVQEQLALVALGLEGIAKLWRKFDVRTWDDLDLAVRVGIATAMLWTDSFARVAVDVYWHGDLPALQQANDLYIDQVVASVLPQDGALDEGQPPVPAEIVQDGASIEGQPPTLSQHAQDGASSEGQPSILSQNVLQLMATLEVQFVQARSLTPSSSMATPQRIAAATPAHAPAEFDTTVDEQRSSYVGPAPAARHREAYEPYAQPTRRRPNLAEAEAREIMGMPGTSARAHQPRLPSPLRNAAVHYAAKRYVDYASPGPSRPSARISPIPSPEPSGDYHEDEGREWHQNQTRQQEGFRDDHQHEGFRDDHQHEGFRDERDHYGAPPLPIQRMDNIQVNLLSVEEWFALNPPPAAGAANAHASQPELESSPLAQQTEQAPQAPTPQPPRPPQSPPPAQSPPEPRRLPLSQREPEPQPQDEEAPKKKPQKRKRKQEAQPPSDAQPAKKPRQPRKRAPPKPPPPPTFVAGPPPPRPPAVRRRPPLPPPVGGPDPFAAAAPAPGAAPSQPTEEELATMVERDAWVATKSWLPVLPSFVRSYVRSLSPAAFENFKRQDETQQRRVDRARFLKKLQDEWFKTHPRAAAAAREAAATLEAEAA